VPKCPSLSDDEWTRFRSLLLRYCSWNLDQWDAWRTTTPFGPAYITMSHYPEQSVTPESYDSLDGDGSQLPHHDKVRTSGRSQPS